MKYALRIIHALSEAAYMAILLFTVAWALRLLLFTYISNALG